MPWSGRPVWASDSATCAWCSTILSWAAVQLECSEILSGARRLPRTEFA